jgi:hypothetical protein
MTGVVSPPIAAAIMAITAANPYTRFGNVF